MADKQNTRVTYGDVARAIEEFAPLSLQEDYDNSGLQVGEPDTEVTGILLCFDVTEEVLSEAIEHGCNLIVSHHPLIFRGLKRLRGDSAESRIVMRALRENVGLYAAHTNLDAAPFGVNTEMARLLGLENVTPLAPQRSGLYKVAVYVPDSHLSAVREALFAAGGGHIGAYSHCSFATSGEGTFYSGHGTKPYIGAPGSLSKVQEVRVETIVPSNRLPDLLSRLLAVHPYEEPAYDIYKLENQLTVGGLGAVGDLPTLLSVTDFFALLKRVFSLPVLRASEGFVGQVQRVALCGGSGMGFYDLAMASGAQAYVTGDVKYHDFQRPTARQLLVDIGHRESELCAVSILKDLLAKKFSNFALRVSVQDKGPLTYYIG